MLSMFHDEHWSCVWATWFISESHCILFCHNPCVVGMCWNLLECEGICWNALERVRMTSKLKKAASYPYLGLSWSFYSDFSRGWGIYIFQSLYLVPFLIAQQVACTLVHPSRRLRWRRACTSRFQVPDLARLPSIRKSHRPLVAHHQKIEKL